jgi:hypothetical protein
MPFAVVATSWHLACWHLAYYWDINFMLKIKTSSHKKWESRIFCQSRRDDVGHCDIILTFFLSMVVRYYFNLLT